MPSLRTHRWDAIRENLAATTSDATLYPLGAKYASYAQAINEGWRTVDEPYFFLAADDLVFNDGWLEAALAQMTGIARVVGSNDLHNPFVLDGKHATHSLVDRRYIEDVGGVIDQGPGSFLYPYDHGYTDSEFIETARYRGVFAPALDCVVEHLHPDFNGRQPDEVDARTRRKWRADFDIFESRRALWDSGGEELPYLAPA